MPEYWIEGCPSYINRDPIAHDHGLPYRTMNEQGYNLLPDEIKELYQIDYKFPAEKLLPIYKRVREPKDRWHLEDGKWVKRPYEHKDYE